MSITSFKCPNCGADVPFDSSSGQLKCQHCDTVYDIENIQALNVETESKTDTCDWSTPELDTVDVDGKKVYVCPSCGGEVVGDDNMASTSCPYCGTAIVVKEQLSGILQPDLVIPFKLDREAAKNAYINFLKKKIFLPNDFKINNIIDKLNGIYVPYWLFDADASGQARFRATRTSSHRSGDYLITETRHYLVFRDGEASFEKVPVDASSKLDDALLDSLEPFDYREAKPFNNAYLANYLADKYDQDENQTVNKANNRIKNSLSQLLASSVIGYQTVVPEGINIDVKNGKATYALLPIYIFSTKYNGKIYQFAMNGQTGEFAGDLPVDKKKAIVYSLLVFAISFVVLFVAFYLMARGS